MKLKRKEASQRTKNEKRAVRFLLKNGMASKSQKEVINDNALMEETLSKRKRIENLYVPVYFIH